MTFEVRKIGYLTQVNVVDGVPQCPCCQEPMVQRGEGWMCAIGAAGLDLLADAMARLDSRVVIGGNPCCGGNGVEASCPECRGNRRG